MHSELPYLKLEEPFCLFEAFLYEPGEIAHRCKFHHDAKMLRFGVKEGLAVPNDMRMLNGSKDADLVQSVALILFLHVHDLDLH